jgi:nitrite reductase/ring-hydroxylating ferredoxin subunit
VEPAATSPSGSWHRVELNGDRGLIVVAGEEIAVFRAEGRPIAVANACPHEGNPLVEGELLGSMLVCAYHGWRFDLETGACLLGERPVRRYPAEERDGAVWVRA